MKMMRATPVCPVDRKNCEIHSAPFFVCCVRTEGDRRGGLSLSPRRSTRQRQNLRTI